MKTMKIKCTKDYPSTLGTVYCGEIYDCIIHDDQSISIKCHDTGHGIKCIWLSDYKNNDTFKNQFTEDLKKDTGSSWLKTCLQSNGCKNVDEYRIKIFGK
jgi:hypothetical protein